MAQHAHTHMQNSHEVLSLCCFEGRVPKSLFKKPQKNPPQNPPTQILMTSFLLYKAEDWGVC